MAPLIMVHVRFLPIFTDIGSSGNSMDLGICWERQGIQLMRGNIWTDNIFGPVFYTAPFIILLWDWFGYNRDSYNHFWGLVKINFNIWYFWSQHAFLFFEMCYSSFFFLYVWRYNKLSFSRWNMKENLFFFNISPPNGVIDLN